MFEVYKKYPKKLPKFVKIKNERITFLSTCSVRNSKILKFINEQEPRGLLGKLGIITPLSKIPLVGHPLLF